MGKIRVKTIGDETIEKKDQKKAEARAAAKKAREEAEARKAAKEAGETASIKTAQIEESPAEEKKLNEAKSASGGKTKKAKFATVKKQTHSASYLAVAEKIDKNKKYKIADAIALLPSLKRAQFDETVELHINTTEKGISGQITLPHGTGKQTRVVIANQSVDPKAVEKLINNIEAGTIDFDVLIATPDTMPKLAKVARVLGPRGLMPNPKNGTVTPKPDEIAKKFAGGQMNFKTESKFPILHMVVGKLSFTGKQLEENIKTAIAAVTNKKIKNVTLKSTMSPGIKLDLASR